MTEEEKVEIDTPRSFPPTPSLSPGDEGYLTEKDNPKPLKIPVTEAAQVGDKFIETEGKPLPDRRFRDAWQLNGEVVSIDLPKAKQIARVVIRREREDRMKRLDNAWMMAMGKKQQALADAIEARRQKLRDAPTDPRLETNDPAQLKTVLDTIVTEMENEASA